ncbi:MAG: OmpA family protein [Proteobacteria bacterium]|nr:MAG: OmpA family protein [Pseudomonadota bacterium]
MKKHNALALASALTLSLTVYSFAVDQPGESFDNTKAEASLGTAALDGGVMRDSDYVREHCGVGNYMFRHDVGCNKTSVTQNDEIEQTQSAIDMSREEVVYFDTNVSSVKSDQEDSLDDLVVFLEENPAAKIEISGFADATGSTRYNENLANKRAQQVRDYLIQAEIPASRVAIVMPEEPVSDTPNNAPDRKVEMRVVPMLAE